MSPPQRQPFMEAAALLLGLLLLLAASGLVAWALRSMARDDADLLAFSEVGSVLLAVPSRWG